MADPHPGWSSDPDVSLRHRIALYGLTMPPGTGVDSADVAEALDADPRAVDLALEGFDQEGLLTQDERLNGLTFGLNAAGERQARAWAAFARDRRSRAMACRSALLDWLYEQPEGRKSDFGYELLQDCRSYFYGAHFNESEIDQARSYLGDEKLVTGIRAAENLGGYLRPKITSVGRTCVELCDSDVARYLNRSFKELSVNYNTNIHGSSGFQVANASQGATMHSTVTITDDHRKQLVAITREIADQIGNLPADVRPAAMQALGDVESAVQSPTAEKGRVRAAFEKVTIAAVTAMGTEAGKSVVTLAGQALSSLGDGA